MIRLVPHAVLACTLMVVPTLAWSQPVPTSKAAETVDEEPAAPPPAEKGETSAAENIDARRKQALVEYGIGNVDPALEELKALVKTCEGASETQCPDELRAKLYVALAIVLAGGKDDIKGGARLFHAALTRDPSVTVPREFATRPVQAAMREANESTSYSELSDSTRSEEQSGDAQAVEPPVAPEPEVEPTLPSDNKTGLILLHALAGAGTDDYGDAGSIGAALVLGARFVDSSAWTTAIRGRAAIVGDHEAAVGGVSLLMGGSWFNPKNRRLGYFLGGVGLDSYGGEGGVSVNGMGGVSLGGFLIGGGLDFGASGYGSFGMMNLHLGWGARL